MKVVELQLVLLLHRVAILMAAQINCSRYGPGDMAVSATCDWTGHVSLSWTTKEPIILYYNCTGSVEKSGRAFGWAYGTRAHFNIPGWNYRNNTCYIHGCYVDESYSTYSIPNVACTVLKSPLPTPTQVLELIRTKSLDVSASSYFYDELSMNLDESQSTSPIEISELPRTTSRTQQTPLLILAATVSVAVIASLSFVLLVIGVTSARRKRRKNLHKLHLHLPNGTDDEVKIEPPRITADDIISIESDFDPLVPNNDDRIKDVATAETGSKKIFEPDNVSESKTVPIEEDLSDADQEGDSKDSSDDMRTKEDVEDTAEEQDKSNFCTPTHVNISNSARLKFINHTYLPHLRFHPIKTPEDSSTSTFGTSDYVCTTDTSGIYTSSNRLDYVLFPDGDFSPSSDNIAKGDEFSSDVLSHEQFFPWENPPPPGDKSVVSPRHNIGEDSKFDFMRIQPSKAQETSSSEDLCQGQVETEQGDTSDGEKRSDACCGESISHENGCGFAVAGEDDNVEDVTISGNDRHNVNEIDHIRKLNASVEES